MRKIFAFAVLMSFGVIATHAQKPRPASSYTAATAAGRYISKEFGFSASFPSEVVSVSKDRNLTFFTSWNTEKTWWGDVDILDDVPYELGPVNKEFMDRWFKSQFSRADPTSAVNYSTVQGYPTISAGLTKRRATDGQVVTGRMTYVFVKDRRRIYVVHAWSFPGGDAQERESFIQSFQIQ